MTITYLGSVQNPDDVTNPCATPATDTTGASLLVQGLTFNGVFNDSASNSWAVANYAQENVSPVFARLGYVDSATPNTSASHVLDRGGSIYYAHCMLGYFAGTAATPLDGSSTTGTSYSGSAATSVQPGSVTPSEGGCLCITYITWPSDPGTVTVPTGYTLMQSSAAYTVNNQIDSRAAGAYKIKAGGDTSAENPQWSWTNSIRNAAVLGVFKSDGVSSAPVLSAATVTSITTTTATPRVTITF